MERVIYIVQWDHVNNQSLMYGSVVTQDIDRSIFYQNQMLAPGSIVHTWKDAYNYQAVRQERSLPLLSGGSRYSIRIPENASLDGVILCFEFMDNFKKNVGKFIFGDRESFVCPKEYSSYSAQLVRNGNKDLFFRHFEILRGCETTIFEEIANPVLVEKVHILIPEIRHRMIRLPRKERCEKYANLLIVPPEALLYQDFSIEEWTRERLKKRYRSEFSFVLLTAGPESQKIAERWMSTDSEKFKISTTIK